MLRQAEKRQHRGACALSVIENVNVVQRSAKGERAVGPAVCEAESARGRHRESRQAEERQHWSALPVPAEAAGQACLGRQTRRRRQAEETELASRRLSSALRFLPHAAALFSLQLPLAAVTEGFDALRGSRSRRSSACSCRLQQ